MGLPARFPFMSQRAESTPESARIMKVPWNLYWLRTHSAVRVSMSPGSRPRTRFAWISCRYWAVTAAPKGEICPQPSAPSPEVMRTKPM